MSRKPLASDVADKRNDSIALLKLYASALPSVVKMDEILQEYYE